MPKLKPPVKYKKVKKSVVKKLAGYFNRNGYFRIPDPKMQKKKKSDYKKGYEIRFVAKDKKELSEMKSLLKEAEMKAGKPFNKFNQYVLPVYGKEKYLRFRELLADLKIKVRTHKK